MSNPEAGVFKKENPRKARSDFRVENGRNAPDRPLNTGKKRYEREGILIERAQGDETTDDSSDAILSTKVTGTEVVRHREDLKNNPLVTEEMQMLREKLLQSSTVSETVAQQKGLEDENEEFEISPFVGKDVDAFTTFINDMDADLVSDDEPCPELLIEALKKTGVTIALIDNVEHTVTISQKLKSGRVKEHVLTPHEVLEFLKDAIDFYEDTYADLEYKKSADFKNILMHEKTKPQTVGVDQSIASLSQESVEIVPNFSYYRDLSPEETLVYEQLDVLGFTESVRDLVPAFEKLDVGEKKEIKNKVLSLRDTYIRTYVANTYAQVINGERKSTSALGNAIISAREFLRIPQNKKRQAQEIEKMKKELHFSNLEKLLEVLVRDVRESGLFDMYEDDEETDNKYVKLFSECVVNEESTPASIITEEANEVLNDTEKSQKIVEVSNFEELNVVLQQIGTIKNNENKITETEEYIQRITKLIEHLESATAPFPMDDAVIRSFPSTYGVRGKIIDLIRENDIKKFPGIVSEKVDVEIQDDFEDSHLDSADSQDSVVNTGAGIDSVSDEPVLKTLHSIDLNLDEAVTPVRKKETFDSRFTLEFDIGEKEMNSIEGFQDLSVPQQKMLFENLKEYAERGDKTWLDKGWSGIKASFGIKGEGIPSLGSKGMKAYGEVLKKLVYAADKFGPKVHEDETNGELRVDFIGLNPERAHRQEQKEVENALNDAAHAFAHVPESWQEDGNGVHAKNESSVTTFFKEKFMGGLSASRRRYHEFEEKQTAFDVAKREFAHKLEETGVPQAEIVRTLIDIEAKVHNLRFIDTNPEAVEALKSITETGFWEMAGRTAVGASGYFALGMGSRAIISGAFGMLSGPAVAAGIGSIRSWNKFNAEQRDRDRQARMGDADTSDGALNIVSASKDIQITDKDGGVEKREVGITAKLENLVTKFKNLSDTVTLEERNKLLDTLNARTLYSLDKFKLNRIQFGSKEEFATKQAKFFEVLSMAQIILAELKMDIEGDDSSITKRIVKYMNYRESSISSKRTHARAKNVAWAATKAAAFSLAGAFAMEEIKTGNVSETVRHWFNRGAEIETFNTVSIANVGSMSSGMIEEPISIIPQTPNVDSIKPNESLLPNEKIISKFLPYQIKSGDTLTKIVKENIPAIKGITNAMEKERVLANLFRSLTPQELSAIGIRSGDVNVIYTGDSIKLDALAEIVASKKSL